MHGRVLSIIIFRYIAGVNVPARAEEILNKYEKIREWRNLSKQNICPVCRKKFKNLRSHLFSSSPCRYYIDTLIEHAIEYLMEQEKNTSINLVTCENVAGKLNELIEENTVT